MDRTLVIKVAKDGKTSISGDSFTVGELLEIGQMISRVTQGQTITFTEKKDEAGDGKNPERQA
jgi:hypothetical protein